MEHNVGFIIGDIVSKFYEGDMGYSFTFEKPPADSFYIQEVHFVKIDIHGEKPLSVVIKNMTKATFEDNFHNEILMYKSLLPMLRDDAQRLFPRVLYASSLPIDLDKSAPAIALEDLRQFGFKHSSGRIYLEMHEVRAALKSLGVVHGEFYSLKLNKQELLNDAIKDIRPVALELKETAPNPFSDFIKALIEESFLRVWGRIVAKRKDVKAKTFFDQLTRMKAMNMCLNCWRTVEPLAVLCHGDYNRNNLLFRTRNNVTECKIIDLQTPHYGSPARDLAFLLFMNIESSESRQKNWQSLWKEYYDALLERIHNSFGYDYKIPLFLSLESLQEDFKRNCFSGYLSTMFFTYTSLIDPKFANDKHQEFQALRKEDEQGRLACVNDILNEMETEKVVQVLDDLSLEYLDNFYDVENFS